MDRREFLLLSGGVLVPTSTLSPTEELRTAETALRALATEISQSQLPSPQATRQLMENIENRLTTARPSDGGPFTYPFDEVNRVMDIVGKVVGVPSDPVNRMFGHIERRYAAVNDAIEYYSQINQVLDLGLDLIGTLRETDRRLFSDTPGLPKPGLTKQREANQRDQFETNTTERDALIETQTPEFNRLLPDTESLERDIKQFQQILLTHASVQREYLRVSKKITKGIQRWEQGDLDAAESLYQEALDKLRTEIPEQLTEYRVSPQSPSLGDYQRAQSLYQDACSQFKRSARGGASNEASVNAIDTGLAKTVEARTQLQATTDA